MAFNSKSTTAKRNLQRATPNLLQKEIYSSGHDPHYHELMSRFWPINTLIHTLQTHGTAIGEKMAVAVDG